MKINSIVIVGIMLAVTFMFVVNVEGADVTVDDDWAGADFSTIQDAVDAAVAGDDIWVHAGWYNESVDVTEAVDIVGNGSDVTFVDGDPGWNGSGGIGFYVTEHKITLAGMWIHGYPEGVYLEGSDTGTVFNNTIVGGTYAIRSYRSTRWIIHNNTIMDTAYGIYIDEERDNEVYCNNITNVTTLGIYATNTFDVIIVHNNVTNAQTSLGLYFARHSIVRGNNLTFSAVGIVDSNGFENTITFNNLTGEDKSFGIQLHDTYKIFMDENNMVGCGLHIQSSNYTNYVHKITEDGNTVNGLPMQYMWGESTLLMNGNYGQVILIDCDDIIVANQIFADTTAGIEIFYSNITKVRNCTFDRVEYGIYADVANETTVKNNDFADVTYGVYNDQGVNWTFETLNFTNASSRGIFLTVGSVASLTDLRFDSCVDAVYISTFSTISISDVTIDAGNHGIYTNTVKDNLIERVNVTRSISALSIQYGSNTTVKNCIFNSSYQGVLIAMTSDVTLWSTELTGGGVIMDGSSEDNYVTHSIPTNNTLSYREAPFEDFRPILYLANTTDLLVDGDYAQIILANCSNVSVTGQMFEGGATPFLAIFSDNFTLENSWISNSTSYGIFIRYCENGTFMNNTIIEINSDGAYVMSTSYCTWINNSFIRNAFSGLFSSGGTNNTYYLNRFDSNNGGFFGGQVWEFGHTNCLWDNGTIGNYWSDYHGYDNDGDGIGDTPYQLFTFMSPALYDNYPWGEFAPRLANCTVTPVNGTSSTSYTFTVNYTDYEENPAEIVKLYLNGSVYNMTANWTGSWTEGWIFYFNTTGNVTLEPGQHFMDYTAFDGVRWGTRNCSLGPYVNYPANLTNISATPMSGASTATYTFYVDYTDMENETAEEMTISIDGGASEDMWKYNISDTDATDGITYMFNTTLDPGNHTFDLSTYDAWEWTFSTNHTGPYVNHPPELPLYMVDPAWGDNETVFTFMVSYNDVETENATEIYIDFDWASYAMVQNGSCPCTNGTQYIYNTTLLYGYHNYSFRASDGIEWNSTEIDTVKVNREPVLVNGTINPVEGNSSVWFTFSVTYSDIDGDEPDWVNLDINDVIYNMTRGVWDGNYSNETVYTYETFLNADNYTYNFSASDGYETAMLMGGNISVNQSDIPVKPVAYITEILPNPARSFDLIHFLGYGSGGNITEWNWTSDVDGYLHDGDEFNSSDLSYGYHNISFTVMNDDDLWSDPVNESVFVNSPPQLIDRNVDPAWGVDDTVFNFTVTYVDADEANATQVLISIGGDSFDMDIASWCPCDGGVVYTYTTTLDFGEYAYNFSATDGMEWAYTDDLTLKVDQAPVLSGFTVSPLEGNTSTTFYFNVTYTDADNDAPESIDMVIDGDSFAMTQVNASDDDYTDGALFSYHTLLDEGNHTYYAEATDGWISVRTDQLTGYLEEGDDTVIVLENVTYIGNATFTITWTDEPDHTSAENEGDTFKLTVVDPNGTEMNATATNEHGEEGIITITFEYNDTEVVTGNWTITVTLVDAGEQEAIGWPTNTTDFANNFTLHTPHSSQYIEEATGTIKPIAYIDSITPNPAEPGEKVFFVGHGSGGEITDYEWTSSIDGDLSTEAGFNKSALSVGSHNITLRVRNDDDMWSDTVTKQLTVIGMLLPDLEIDTITIVPSEPKEGDEVSIVINLENIGNLSGNFSVGVYYHDANGSYSAVGDLTLIETFNITIGADSSDSHTIFWEPVEGAWEIVVWGDPNGEVTELMENNNVKDKKVTVTEGEDEDEEKSEPIDATVGFIMLLIILGVVAAIFFLMRKAPEVKPPADETGGADDPGWERDEDDMDEGPDDESGESPMPDEPEAPVDEEGDGGSKAPEDGIDDDRARRKSMGSPASYEENFDPDGTSDGSKAQDYNSSRSNRRGVTAPEEDLGGGEGGDDAGATDAQDYNSSRSNRRG